MSAELLFLNGQVVTMDQHDRVVEAMATRGNRIVAVGSNADVLAWKGPNTRVIDLGGRSLLPGLIDAHCHLVLYGVYLTGLDCRFPRVKSIPEIQEKIRAAAADTPPGSWIRGWAYDHKKLAEGRHPTRWELDQAAPDHPVLLVRTDYHTSVANSKALAVAGVTKATPDPKGGRIGRDEGGEPNGLLVDAAHMKMMEWAMPSRGEFEEAIARGAEAFLRLGITSLHDAGGFGRPQFEALSRARQNGRLAIRVYALVWSMLDPEAVVESFIGTGLGTGFGDPWLRLGHVKLMVDGSSSGPSAAVWEPYDSDPEDRGILYYTQEEVNDVFSRAVRHGFDVTAHAVGDRGVEIVVGAVEAAKKALPAGRPWRPRIEHCGIVNPELLRRIKAAGIVPVPQPTFCYDFGDGYLRDYGKRTDFMFAGRSFFDAGIPAAGSSDAPVTTPDPMLGIATAVLRRTRSGQEIGKNQAVSVKEALRMYTYHAAYASYEEADKGSIEVGKLADLVVLSDPILDVGVETIRDMRAVMTVLDGRVVCEEPV